MYLILERIDKMGLFGSGNTMNMIHQDGLPGYSKGTAITMTLNEVEKCLIFKARVFKNPEVKLPLQKVSFAGMVATEQIEKQSALGRAVVGGVLFGAAGAIIGAMSAEEKKKNKYFYIINYQKDGETKAITMLENGGNMNYFKFQKKLTEYLPKKSESTINL